MLTILQIPGWSDIGRSVTIRGEVLYPGNYGINEGEHLSTFLKRVGGFRSTAYPAGIVLERQEVRKLEEQGREELISRIQSTSSGVKFSPSATGQDQAAVLQAVQQQQQQAIANLRAQPVPGRLVINITATISDWENTSADIPLRAGDVIVVPKKPTFVLSYGQVYNANAITYKPGKNAGWYLKQAGGPTQLANKRGIYIVRANGSVISANGVTDFFSGGVLSTKMQPGDVLGRVLEIVLQAAGDSRPVVQDKNLLRPYDRPSLFSDITKIRREMDWRPAVGIEEGLTRLVRQPILAPS